MLLLDRVQVQHMAAHVASLVDPLIIISPLPRAHRSLQATLVHATRVIGVSMAAGVRALRVTIRPSFFTPGWSLRAHVAMTTSILIPISVIIVTWLSAPSGVTVAMIAIMIVLVIGSWPVAVVLVVILIGKLIVVSVIRGAHLPARTFFTPVFAVLLVLVFRHENNTFYMS